jgi:hypothetical protein
MRVANAFERKGNKRLRALKYRLGSRLHAKSLPSFPGGGSCTEDKNNMSVMFTSVVRLQ